MKSKKAIDNLADNVSSFFDQFEKKFQNSMKCKAGCSACCYTDLSVFSIESDNIVSWFNDQSAAEKTRLRNLWATPVNEGACEFLYEDKCTIYEARPIICRSHGVLIKVKENAADKFDICPLNETPETVSAKPDALDLDRLNTLLSLAQNNHDASGKRVRLKDLKKSL